MERQIVWVAIAGLHKEECAWMCHNQAEAERMANWLISLGLQAVYMSTQEHDALPDVHDEYGAN